MFIRPLKIPRAFMGGDFDESHREEAEKPQKNRKARRSSIGSGLPSAGSGGLVDSEVD